MKTRITYLALLSFGLIISSCKKDELPEHDHSGDNHHDTITHVDTILYHDTTGSEGGGKTFLVFSGDISDAEAQAKINSDLGPGTQILYINNTSNLITIDLSGIEELVELKIVNNSALTDVLLPDLKSVSDYFTVRENAVLTNLVLNNLEALPNLDLSTNDAITSLDLSSLSLIHGSVYVGGNASLTSIDLSALTEVGEGFNMTNTSVGIIDLPLLSSVGSNFSLFNNAVNTLNIPNLNTVGNTFDLTGNNSLSSLDLRSLSSIVDQAIINGNTSLASIDISTWTFIPPGGFQASANALPSSEINALLAHFVAMAPPISSNSIVLVGQNPVAPPTGQGITDRSTLITNGNSVITD